LKRLKNRFRAWLEGLSSGPWILLQTVLAVVALAIGEAIIAKLASDVSWLTRAVLVLVLIVGAGLYFWIALAAGRVRDRVFPKHPAMLLGFQRELNDALMAENSLISDPGGRTKKQTHWEVMQLLLRATQRPIGQQWADARFGSAAQTDVVLMTKSLLDGEMTCACWVVRRPVSLERRAIDTSVYNDTEAARMYRSAEQGRVGPRIIPDTTASGSDYHFLNASETERIRSTVLHPVYDPASQLIGVVVAHTNRPDIFRSEDIDFWSGLFRLVEPHVARRIILAQQAQWLGDPPW
jgi:hypothetical protein